VYLVMCLMKRCIRVKIREKLEFIFQTTLGLNLTRGIA
jgi:hypothetical protein